MTGALAKRSLLAKLNRRRRFSRFLLPEGTPVPSTLSNPQQLAAKREVCRFNKLNSSCVSGRKVPLGKRDVLELSYVAQIERLAVPCKH